MVESKHPLTKVAQAALLVAGKLDEYPGKFVKRLEASQKVLDTLFDKSKLLQAQDKAPKGELKAFFPALTEAQKEARACLRLCDVEE
jgi:hypothetical protein